MPPLKYSVHLLRSAYKINNRALYTFAQQEPDDFKITEPSLLPYRCSAGKLAWLCCDHMLFCSVRSWSPGKGCSRNRVAEHGRPSGSSCSFCLKASAFSFSSTSLSAVPPVRATDRRGISHLRRYHFSYCFRHSFRSGYALCV